MSQLGIVLHVCGLWILSSLDASGKLLVVAGVPVLMVAWFRYVGHVVLMGVLVLPRRGMGLFRTQSLSRQIQRSVLMIATTLLFFHVLGMVPLAEGTAMNFMAPLLVMALAPWLLGERPGWHRWAGVVLGFVGMLVVIRPGGQLSTEGAIWGVVTASTFALFQISTRRVAADDPLTSNLYGGLFGALVLSALLPFFWQQLDLTVWQWLLLASTGLSGFVGHWLQITAYSKTSATLLAPFNYLQIVSATTLGWLIFGQLPDAATAAGMALICCAGLGVVLVEVWQQRLRKRLSA
ncbi:MULTISPECIES: DMT family transporter [Comamonas]|jgi:drug/metabolite transporter (DMT)-like permease|uniref:DMT family transporter n=1 Tax=Comamonas sediminis TaxID=1783360 RepID=A0ABV4B969_9BURK|nr:MULTISPECIES: DMT family transporter [unclassified Comamonas]ULR87298.1 DMT family transporter [Comamonas sp. B21-038]